MSVLNFLLHFYRFYQFSRHKPPVIFQQCGYPYGFGPSYTSFALKDIRFTGADAQTSRFSVTVKNTGSRKGAEVVQAYVGAENSKIKRPIKALKGFQRVELEAGEEREVRIDVHFDDLAWYNESTGAVEKEDTLYTAYIGTDARSSVGNAVVFRFDEAAHT